ncbi:Aste57867_21255 [Aphanomyces stellatus]|uniref:Aste57867_21255 protein n=1 Tax=Aphanomyces stellatus TaxID=120398 RepID=A0A485LIG8_9STRA|nr:hypothetical protein As57867_021186 [Aphanomyces stellatus]VFT97927.1 Aste57867_21255 [Aphanomyces stellatus]
MRVRGKGFARRRHSSCTTATVTHGAHVDMLPEDATIRAEDIIRESCESYPSDCESMWDSSRSLTDLSTQSLGDVLASQRSTFQEMQPIRETTVESMLLESMSAQDMTAILDDTFDSAASEVSQSSMLVEDDPRKSRQAKSRWAQQVRLKAKHFLDQSSSKEKPPKKPVALKKSETEPPASSSSFGSPQPSTLQKWNRWLTDHYNSNVKHVPHYSLGKVLQMPNPLALWAREDPHTSHVINPLSLVSLEEVVQTPKMMRYYASWLTTEPDQCKLFFLCSLDEYRVFWRMLVTQTPSKAARDMTDESRSMLQTYGRKIFAKYLVPDSQFYIGDAMPLRLDAVEADISTGGEAALHAFDAISRHVKQYLMQSYPQFRAHALYADMMNSCPRELLPLDCILLNRLFCNFFWLFLFQHQYHNELALFMEVQYDFKFLYRAYAMAPHDAALLERGTRMLTYIRLRYFKDAQPDLDVNLTAAVATLQDEQEVIVQKLQDMYSELYFRFIASQAYAEFAMYSRNDSTRRLSELLLHYGLRAHFSYAADVAAMSSPPLLEQLPPDWIEAIVSFESTASTNFDVKWTPQYVKTDFDGPIDAFLVPWCKTPHDCRIQSSTCPAPFAFNTHVLIQDVEMFAAVLTLFRPNPDDPSYFLPYGVAVFSKYPLHTSLRQRLSEIYEKCIPGYVPGMVATLSAPLPTTFVREMPELPCVDYSLALLFDTLDLTNIMTLFTAALLECRILLISSQYTVLAVVAETLRTILNPLGWPHVYVPVMPGRMLDYLQCPTPFLFGVQKDLLDASLLSASCCLEWLPMVFCLGELGDEVVCVDLDTSVVVQGELPVDLPSPVWKRLHTTLRLCLKLHVTKSDHVFGHSFEREARHFPDMRIRMAFYDAVMAVIGLGQQQSDDIDDGEDVHFGRFRYVWDDQYDEKVVFFDEAGYLAQSHPAMRAFRTCFIATQAFSEFIVARNGFV